MKPLHPQTINNREHDETLRAKRVVYVDSEGGSVVQTIESDGNLNKTSVNDEGANQLLGDILKEVKKLNIQLMSITGDYIGNNEVE